MKTLKKKIVIKSLAKCESIIKELFVYHQVATSELVVRPKELVVVLVMLAMLVISVSR